MKKEHAEHNENACDFLLESKRYNDWVITTAFYSALHYVHHEIFPLEIEGEEYETFDDYYADRFKNVKDNTKHAETKNLVRLYFPQGLSYYNVLFDSCMTARYKSYAVSDESAKKARERLTLLKGFLKK